MSDPSVRGRFVWYDLMTPDAAAAIPFYTAVTGWGTQEWKPQDGGHTYTMWTANGTPLGGIMPPPPQAGKMPPHWLPYIGTPDTDATAKRAKEIGGRVLHEPMDIPTIGRFAVLADPQGAVFAVFTALTPMDSGEEGKPKLGQFSWHELIVPDHKAAFPFYADLFGWVLTEAMDMSADMGPGSVYQMYGHNGVTLGGMFSTANTQAASLPPHWMLYVSVDNADRASERVVKHGGKILNGPMDVPGGGRIAQCMDPQGGAFAVHSGPAA